ncbi:MAG: DUF4832 domain-containing protein [Chloroflexi bacterium]|nr:DUF4832 domain-containing protein [Chloroflexota bacterium]
MSAKKICEILFFWILTFTGPGPETVQAIGSDSVSLRSGTSSLTISTTTAAASEEISISNVIAPTAPTLPPNQTFADVPIDHEFYDVIEALYQAGYTAGCQVDPLLYCPEQAMIRAESAVFVQRGVHGAEIIPPDPTSQIFADLAIGSWAAKWVTQLYNDGFTAGCGEAPLVYCPWQGHTRTEGTVFYLRMLNGADYLPPEPLGIFADVALDFWGADWIEAAYNIGLILVCGENPLRFCPDEPLTRAMAAYMMVQAKGLTMLCTSCPPDCGTCSMVRVKFTPSSEDFANPERGFMRQVQIWPDATDPVWGLTHPRQPSDTLVWIYFRLDNYRSKPLDAAGLTRISAAFDTARTAGIKVVIRFIYNWGSGGSWSPDPSTWAPDATLPQVLQHIKQLTPLLEEHSDVIAVLQAGFVGHWGEWHSSKNDLTSAENQKAILDALIDALPTERMLQLRYPRDKNTHYAGPLSEAAAFSGEAEARIGHHNDCFLANKDDSGTYRSAPRGSPSDEIIAYWMDFITQEGRFTPVGGEACNEGNADVTPRSMCPTALQELEMLHWSFINNGYNKAVLDGWAADGCMDTIRLRLGYRLVLTEALVPSVLPPGSAFDLEVSLRNDGYAAMFNARPVFVVLDGAGLRYTARLQNVDPRRWESGTSTTINVRLQLPAGLADGSYRLSLWLPDQASSLQNSPKYTVRFANTDVWEASSGLNILTTNFTVVTDAQGIDDRRALELRELAK